MQKGWKINPSTIYLSLIIPLIIISFISCNQRKTEWQGTIEVVDGVTVVKNPKEPLSKNSGRIMQLKEAVKISETGKDFYFKSPGPLRVSSDGSIFIRDFEQLLQFSSNGQFKKNYFKKGRGPWEIGSTYSFSYFIFQDEILIFADGRIRRYDLSGNQIEDIKSEGIPFGLLDITKNWYISWRQVQPPMSEWKGEIADIQNIIIPVSKQNEGKDKRYVFPTDSFLGPQTRMDLVSLLWVTDSAHENIYVSHTTEYLIKILSLNERMITRHFKREYSKVTYTLTDEELERNRRFNRPSRKYKNDVEKLYLNKDVLWVQTSTQDELRGTLFDVFNNEGMYIDNFYLKVEGKIMTVFQDSIYVEETDSSGNIQIVKYNIIG